MAYPLYSDVERGALKSTRPLREGVAGVKLTPWESDVRHPCRLSRRLLTRVPTTWEVQRGYYAGPDEIQEPQAPALVVRHRGKWSGRVPRRVDTAELQIHDGKRSEMDRGDVHQVVEHRYTPERPEHSTNPSLGALGQRQERDRRSQCHEQEERRSGIFLLSQQSEECRRRIRPVRAEECQRATYDEKERRCRQSDAEAKLPPRGVVAK